MFPAVRRMSAMWSNIQDVSSVALSSIKDSSANQQSGAHNKQFSLVGNNYQCKTR